MHRIRPLDAVHGQVSISPSACCCDKNTFLLHPRAFTSSFLIPVPRWPLFSSLTICVLCVFVCRSQVRNASHSTIRRKSRMVPTRWQVAERALPSFNVERVVASTATFLVRARCSLQRRKRGARLPRKAT